MLPLHAQILAILLTMTAFIGCTQKNDYNLVIGLGIIYLGSKHSYLQNLISFSVILLLTLAVDVIQIIVATNQGTFMRYVITILEIIFKIGILISLRRKANKKQQSKGANQIHQFHH